MRLRDRGWVDYDTFMGKVIGETPYLLQRVERNHAFFDRYTDALATVRVCILLAGGGGIRIPFAVLKLPARGNLADNFWRPRQPGLRPGAPETGRILTVRTKNPLGTSDYDAGTRRRRRRSRAECVRCGSGFSTWPAAARPIFQAARYQWMDIAVTQPKGRC